ncbi:ABC transporter G family member 20-like [Amaranthus tricolor]|uniref:ABC transporter G family member 20-like n=1 Tax=Amaranthus tricolor TaxID=29722 RepID=UPI002585A70D|nr:ABC transporter G family member 20-like [Amaranthus tricolor]
MGKQSLDELQPKTQFSQNDNAHHFVELNDVRPTTIPIYPFILAFRNLTFSVKICPELACYKNFSRNGLEDKQLLNDISGEAKGGQIMAVLGASGSGKSTLIDALAGRISKERLQGSVTLNGHEVLRCNTNILKSISAYVMQDVLLFPGLTVEETLMFSGEFCLPRTISKAEKRARVQGLIDQLSLRHAAKTVIGDEEHRGVSGGERKRISIGIEIINDPPILFLDEPTSGLDSTSAFLVTSVLQGICRSGNIVILSIHQPSSRILSILDNLIILSDGQTVYSGSPANISKFFAACSYPIPENENKVEYVLDLITEIKDESPGNITNLMEFNKSCQKQYNNLQELITANLPVLSLIDTVNARFSEFANPSWVEIGVLAKRSLINSTRMPKSFGFRFSAVIFSGAMLATVFWRLDDSPKGAHARLAFFASAIITTFFICSEALPHFVQERAIFMRETSYNSYRKSSYVISHTITTLPPLVLFSFTFSIITFWTIGLNGGLLGFLWYFGFMVASFWTGNSFVTFVSAVVPHVLAGYTVVITFLAQFTLFSGLFIPRGQIPHYWIWFHYMSLVKYPYQGVLHNEFNNPMTCLVNGMQMFDNTLIKDAPRDLKGKVFASMSSILGINITSSTCVMTATDILQQQGVTDLSRLDCLWITIAWGFFFRILFYFALLFGNKNKRT